MREEAGSEDWWRPLPDVLLFAASIVPLAGEADEAPGAKAGRFAARRKDRTFCCAHNGGRGACLCIAICQQWHDDVAPAAALVAAAALGVAAAVVVVVVPPSSSIMIDRGRRQKMISSSATGRRCLASFARSSGAIATQKSRNDIFGSATAPDSPPPPCPPPLPPPLPPPRPLPRPRPLPPPLPAVRNFISINPAKKKKADRSEHWLGDCNRLASITIPCRGLPLQGPRSYFPPTD